MYGESITGTPPSLYNHTPNAYTQLHTCLYAITPLPTSKDNLFICMCTFTINKPFPHLIYSQPCPQGIFFFMVYLVLRVTTSQSILNPDSTDKGHHGWVVNIQLYNHNKNKLLSQNLFWYIYIYISSYSTLTVLVQFSFLHFLHAAENALTTPLSRYLDKKHHALTRTTAAVRLTYNSDDAP